MNCRNARKLMDEVLDGNPAHQARLEEHVAECEQCRAQWSLLSRTQDALAQSVSRSVEPSALEQLTENVLTEVGAREARLQVMPAPRRWLAFAVAAGLLLAFGVGLGAGRTVWPREMTVTKVVTEREVVEKPVEVPVRVVEERVVVKPVPVVKTRIVYRDRPARGVEAPAGKPVLPAAGGSEALAAPEIEIVAVNPVVRREIRPAAVVNASTGNAPLPTPLVGDGDSAAPDSPAGTIMVAQTGSSIVEKGQGEDQ